MPKSKSKSKSRMSKTHHVKNKTMRVSQLSKYNGCPSNSINSTYQGLNKWYIHLFEHLGWMILAKHHGMDDTIAVYKNSIKRICSSIESAMREIKDKDKIRDLKIMHENIIVLQKHVDSDF